MAHASVGSLTRGRYSADPDQRLACLVAASTIPAALIGYFLEDFFEAVRNPRVVVVNLVLVGLFLGLRREEAARFSFLMSCFSSESRKTLTRAALLWYFGAIMYSAVSEFRRFTREGRARSGCVAALLLS